MSNCFEMLEGLMLQTDPSIPVTGVQVSTLPDARPGYIYTDSAEGIMQLLEKHESEHSVLSVPPSPFQEIVAEAFKKAPGDLYVLDQKLSALPGMKQFKAGMVIRCLTEDGQPFVGPQQPQIDIAEGLRAFFPAGRIAVIFDCVYLLISSGEIISEFPVGDREGFEAFLKKHNAFAMTGNSSQWIKGLRVLFRQCYETLPIAAAVRYGEAGGKRLLKYSRFAFYYTIRLAELAAGKDMGSGDIIYLCDDAVLTLTRYDRSFNSDLRDTLFIYLMRDRNISAAAREMHVHRNTVIYKLNQIKALIGDKTEDPYLRHSLISSCMIIRYMENYHKRGVELPPLEKSLLKKNL